MASLTATEVGEGRFFQRVALGVAVITVAGFGLNIVLGRSSFAAPPLVHAHAIVFMGWVGTAAMVQRGGVPFFPAPPGA